MSIKASGQGLLPQRQGRGFKLHVPEARSTYIFWLRAKNNSAHSYDYLEILSNLRNELRARK